MANAKVISPATNGKSVKEHVMGAAETVKAKLGSGPKAPPVELKKTVVTEPQQPEPAAADTEQLSWRQMLADMGFKLPGWKRTLVAYAAAFLSGYVVGATFSALFNYMFGAAILATGWTFMTVIIYIVGLVIAVYAAAKLGQKVGGYILSGDIDADASRAWGWVKGKVSGSPALRAA
jgi:hypothetical protein